MSVVSKTVPLINKGTTEQMNKGAKVYVELFSFLEWAFGMKQSIGLKFVLLFFRSFVLYLPAIVHRPI
jgi:hypothetical protein